MKLNPEPDGFQRFVGQVLEETWRLGWKKLIYVTE